MLGAAAARAAGGEWSYNKRLDLATRLAYHTLQTRLDYEGATVTLAFICARGAIIVTLAASAPVAAILRYKFPPAEWQWIEGKAVTASTIVFDGQPALDLFKAVLAERELVLRIPGPKSMSEKALSLDGVAEKAAPLKDDCL